MKIKSLAMVNSPQLPPKNQPGACSLHPFSPPQLDVGEERRMILRDPMGQGEGRKITC